MEDNQSYDSGQATVDISDFITKIKDSIAAKFKPVTVIDPAFSLRLEKALNKNFEYIKRYQNYTFI